MKIFKKTDETDEFKKDFRKLSKRFPTLGDDLREFVSTQLNLTHKLEQDNQGVFRISSTGYEYPPCYIAKKFTCKSSFGTGVRSGIRVVYVHWEREDAIHFVEIFHKSDKEHHDRRRLAAYLKQSS